MADYVQRLVGEDNLSGTLKKVQQELANTGKAAKDIDKIDQSFNRIVNSSAPVKKQMRDIKNLATQIKFDGSGNARQFLEMAKAAGNAKDVMDDTQATIKFFADDRRWINTGIQGLQAISAAGSVVVGTLGLVGVEQEKVNQAILHCQAVLSILNGIKEVSVLLDKNGYLMTAKRVIGLNAQAAAEAKLTAATEAQTASQLKNNLAVLANPYVLAAGVVIALGAAVYYLKKSIDDSTKSLEEQLEVSKKFEEAKEQENTTLAENEAKYRILQSRWNSLGKDLNAKKKFIVENKTEFHNLGYEVDSVSDAESVLNKNTNSVIKTLKARANAAARTSVYVQVLKEKWAELSEIEKKVANGESFSKSELKGLDVPDPDKDEKFKLVESSLFGFERKYKLAGEKAGKQFLAGVETALDKKYAPVLNPLEKGIQEDYEIIRANTITTSSSGGSGSRGSRNTPPPPKNTPPPKDDKVEEDKEQALGLMGALEKKISEGKEALKYLTDETSIKNKVAEIAKDEADLKALRIRVGLEVDPELEKQKETEAKIKEKVAAGAADAMHVILGFVREIEVYDIFEALHVDAAELLVEVKARPSLNPMAGNSSFENALGIRKFDRSSLEGIHALMDANDKLIAKLEEDIEKFKDLKDTGSDAYKEILEAYNKLKEEQEQLGGEAKDQKDDNDALDEKEKRLNKIGDAFNDLGTIMGSIGSMTDSEPLNAAAIVAQAIATYIKGWTQATAEAASFGPLGWVAFGLSTLAQLAAVVAQIHSLSGYAQGGIISGGSSYGDQILARVNAGEMVLNRKQQNNLFRAIESGKIGGGGNTVLVPDFRIKGSDLYVSLRNYSKSVGKTGKVTGIR